MTSYELYCGNCLFFVPDGTNNHSYCGVNKYGVKKHDEGCFYYDPKVHMTFGKRPSGTSQETEGDSYEVKNSI